MEKQIKRILTKLYSYKNLYYGENHEPLYSEEVLSEKEQAILLACGWETNRVEGFSGHDEILEKLYSLKGSPHLSQKHVVAAFIAGVGGSYLRGRSVLSAWNCFNNIPIHTYNERPEYRCCWICGTQDKAILINDSEFQYIMHLGNAFAGNPKYAYLNLKYVTAHPAIVPTLEDIKIFSKLLELLQTAPADESPGKCEKRIREAKFLPACQHLRGILQSLAQVGVLPNQFISLSGEIWTDFGEVTICEKGLKNTRGRSDMEMPWAGWLGSLKVEEAKVDELFGEYLKQ